MLFAFACYSGFRLFCSQARTYIFINELHCHTLLYNPIGGCNISPIRRHETKKWHNQRNDKTTLNQCRIHRHKKFNTKIYIPYICMKYKIKLHFYYDLRTVTALVCFYHSPSRWRGKYLFNARVWNDCHGTYCGKIEIDCVRLSEDMKWKRRRASETRYKFTVENEILYYNNKWTFCIRLKWVWLLLQKTQLPN